MQGRFTFIQGIVFGCVAFIASAVMPAYAVITHSTDITTNTTWDNSDTHLITANIAVTNNAILTITAGTTVKVDNRTEGPTEFRVDNGGRLVIEGTQTSPVTITSNSAEPGAWSGIIARDGNISIKHAIIEYANTGVSYSGAGASTVIEDSIIRYMSGTGVYISLDGGGQLDLSMLRNEIHNTDTGI